jgi:stress response protein SCP2/NADH pyrophosphatase NudC (nudix superfamily)
MSHLTTLQAGQRLQLTDLGLGPRLSIDITIEGLETDIGCFGLDAQEQLSDDRYFIFYNQPRSPEGAIQLPRPGHFLLDLDLLPSQIKRLVFTATAEAAMRAISRGQVRLGERGLFAFGGQQFSSEQGLMLLALYRKDGAWRVAAIAQGFAGGLAALVEHFGGAVSEEADSTAPTSAALTAPTPAAAPAWAELRDAPTIGQPAGSCARCGSKPNLLNRLNNNGWCKKCEDEHYHNRERFREHFLAVISDDLITDQEWTQLQVQIDRLRLKAAEALASVRGDALVLLERSITIAEADGEISDSEEQNIWKLAKYLRVPDNLTQNIRGRIKAMRDIQQIRLGHLPTVISTIMLNAGEVAHLESTATYRKILSKSEKHIAGQLVITSEKVHFVSSEGGWTIQYKNVSRILPTNGGLTLELSTKQGSGFYALTDAALLAAVLETVVKINRRQLLSPNSERDSRHIPHQVRIAVWQRDGGKCSQCGAKEYLEYDHIIPHSRGGASTLGNVQLLCRRCNLEKSDRI